MNLMKRSILLGILFFAVTTNLSSQQFKSNFKRLTTENGLSQNNINALLQDNDSFMWIGTDNGLNKYDGYEFVVYKSNPRDSTTLSNNKISGLGEDSNGTIWIGTDGGGVSKYDPKTNSFKQYVQKPNDSSKITHNYIYNLFVDSKDRVWAGNWDGLDLYNPDRDIFERVFTSPLDNNYIQGVHSFAEDSQNKIWLGTDYDGIKLYNPETKKIEKEIKHDPTAPNTLLNNHVFRILIDEKGVIWMTHSDEILNGISSYDPHSGTVSQHNELKEGASNSFITGYQDSNKKLWFSTIEAGLKLVNPNTGSLISSGKLEALSKESVSVILEDKMGSLWLGTRSSGLLFLGAKAKPFHFWTNNLRASYTFTKETISRILEDRNGDLWVSNLQAGLRKLNLKTGKVTVFPELHEALKKDGDLLGVTDIIEAKNGTIWVAYEYGVLNIDPSTHAFKKYSYRSDKDNSILSIRANELLEFNDGLIWIGTLTGKLLTFNPETQEFKKKNGYGNEIDPLPGYYVNIIQKDSAYNLLIGFYDEGLHSLNTKNGTFSKVVYQPQDFLDTSAKNVTSLHQDKNILWVGTANGLFKKNLLTNRITHYGIKEGLSNNYICGILEDEQHNLWLSTANGISKFNPVTEQFKTYSSTDGLRQSQFMNNAAFRSLKTNQLFFGGSEGLNFFHPKQIKDNKEIPPIVLTSFKKNSKAGVFVAIPGINLKDKIELGYQERDFVIKFAALNYDNPNKNRYAFQLEGYNSTWTPLDHKRELTFTNLDPGTYNLKIKGANNDGFWNKEGKTIAIIISAPWWGTWWAYFLYTIITLSILYGIYLFRMKQLETLRLTELDEVKSKMYTHITHEFRTPLTVITGLNQQLREHFNNQNKEHFDAIERNSENLLHLVNQLLELRKIEAEKVKIDYIQDDIINYIKYVSESFSSYAKTLEITLHFISATNELIMDYEPNKILVIMSNLLSNAIKYTPSGGNIYLQIDKVKEELQIRVTDTGSGIPSKDLPHVFDRFYKANDSDLRNAEGMGIGLALTKELVQLLNGKIGAKSQIGEGSVFSVHLPIHQKAKIHKKFDEQIIKSKIFNYTPLIRKDTNENILPVLTTNMNTILVIEDNIDVANYLVACLQNQWNVIVATDGIAGVSKAIEIIPNIILCDLMIPELDGYMVLEKLKNNELTNHIPIVLLTAKADDSSKIKGLQKGADAYVVKPFNKNELLVRLEKLVQQRKKLQKRYQKNSFLYSSEDRTLEKQDQFIYRLEELVLSKGYHESYNITSLCKDLGMSRTQLHNKIKALTGKSTSIFIRATRLKKGKYLLENTKKSISEIASEVGFKDASYFSRCFNEIYGEAPSTIRK